MSEELHEEWRPIPEFEGIYEVSSLGRVRRIVGGSGILVTDPPCSRDNPRLLIPQLVNGYPWVRPYKNGVPCRRYIHAIVAEVFIGPRPAGMEVNHRDSNRRNNHPSNLEYVTSSGNRQHALAMGRLKVGEAHYSAKLTDDEARMIRIAHRSGETSYRALARYFKVSATAIAFIVRGKTWRHVYGFQDDYDSREGRSIDQMLRGGER